MSSTSSPTTKSLNYTDLRAGDIVNARGQLAVVVDCLRSDQTDNVCLYLAFVHNIGNSRHYDLLELTPQRAIALGVDQWQPATRADLRAAIEGRRAALERALDEVMGLALAESRGEYLRK